MPFSVPFIPTSAVVTAVLLVTAQSPYPTESSGRSLASSTWETVTELGGARAQLCRETQTDGSAVVWYRHQARAATAESRTLVRWSVGDGWTRPQATRWVPAGSSSGGKRGHTLSGSGVDREQVRVTVVLREGPRRSLAVPVDSLREC